METLNRVAQPIDPAAVLVELQSPERAVGSHRVVAVCHSSIGCRPVETIFDCRSVPFVLAVITDSRY